MLVCQRVAGNIWELIRVAYILSYHRFSSILILVNLVAQETRKSCCMNALDTNNACGWLKSKPCMTCHHSTNVGWGATLMCALGSCLESTVEPGNPWI